MPVAALGVFRLRVLPLTLNEHFRDEIEAKGARPAKPTGVLQVNGKKGGGISFDSGDKEG